MILSLHGAFPNKSFFFFLCNTKNYWTIEWISWWDCHVVCIVHLMCIWRWRCCTDTTHSKQEEQGVNRDPTNPVFVCLFVPHNVWTKKVRVNHSSTINSCSILWLIYFSVVACSINKENLSKHTNEDFSDTVCVSFKRFFSFPFDYLQRRSLCSPDTVDTFHVSRSFRTQGAEISALTTVTLVRAWEKSCSATGRRMFPINWMHGLT